MLNCSTATTPNNWRAQRPWTCQKAYSSCERRRETLKSTKIAVICGVCWWWWGEETRAIGRPWRRRQMDVDPRGSSTAHLQTPQMTNLRARIVPMCFNCAFLIYPCSKGFSRSGWWLWVTNGEFFIFLLGFRLFIFQSLLKANWKLLS